jgi:hypothetical protein
MKRLALLVTALLAVALIGLSVGGATAAPKKVDICPAYGDGTGASGGSPKIDVAGDLNNLFVSAPSGYLIDFYCVKAGTETLIVQVNPPKASIELTAPNGKDISHYSLHFIRENNPYGEWCSPGFWRNNADKHGASQWPVPTDTLYNSVISSPSVAGDPTLLDVLLSPQTYGGAAFNAVATYLSTEAGLNVTDPIVHNCPLDQHGNGSGSGS